MLRVATRGGAFDAVEAAIGQTGGSNPPPLQGGVLLVAGIFRRLTVASGHTGLSGTRVGVSAAATPTALGPAVPSDGWQRSEEAPRRCRRCVMAGNGGGPRTWSVRKGDSAAAATTPPAPLLLRLRGWGGGGSTCSREAERCDYAGRAGGATVPPSKP